MSHKKILILILCLLYYTVNISCDFKKSVHEDVHQIYYFPLYNYDIVELPERMVQSPDSMAQVAVVLVNFANSLKEFADLLVVPMDSVDSGLPWSKNWRDEKGLLTTLIIAQYNEGQAFEWRLTKTGVDNSSNTTYNNWTFIRGSYNLEYRSTGLMIYENNSSKYWVNVNYVMPVENDIVCYYVTTTVDSLLQNYTLLHQVNGEDVLNGFYFNYGIFYSIDTLSYNIVWNEEGQGYWAAENSDQEIAFWGTWD